MNTSTAVDLLHDPHVKHLKTADLMADTGLTFRVLDYWARTGVLEPIPGSCRGSGTARRYTADQVHIARALRVLNRLNASRSALAAAGRALAGRADHEHPGWLLVTAEGRTRILEDGAAAADDVVGPVDPGGWVVRLPARPAGAAYHR